jgi:hypothetical protein
MAAGAVINGKVVAITGGARGCPLLRVEWSVVVGGVL